MKIIAWHVGDNNATFSRIGKSGHKFLSSGKLLAVVTTVEKGNAVGIIIFI